MLSKLRTRATLIFLAVSIFTMYKESPAQQPTSSRTNASAPQIDYTVSMTRPWTHLIEVEMRIRWQEMPRQLELKMPVWTPGSYLIREYARQRRLRRVLISVPLLTPYLSSLWLALVTPTDFAAGRHLIEGLKNPTVVRNRRALDEFPIRPHATQAAITSALTESK